MEREIVCLDTSILIDYFRKKNKETSTFYKLSELNFSFSTTSISTFEIYRGVTVLQRPFWDSLFEQVEVIPFGEEASKIAARLMQVSGLKNRVELPDLFIAAISIQRNLRLATLNRKDFEKIEELRLFPSIE